MGLNKREQLYGELKDRLVTCDPGTPFLTVRSIMDGFDVSQATVSGAIQKLAEEGLLRKNGRRSMEVTEAVLRYRRDAKPVYCLAIPLWPSDHLNMLAQCFLELAPGLKYEPEIYRYDWRQPIPTELPATKIDGLIVQGGRLTGEAICTLEGFGIPYVGLGEPISGVEVNSVCLDEEYSGMLAAHHLWELGHRRFAVAVTEQNSGGTSSRIKGFRQFAELHGCPVEVIDCDIQNGDFSPEKNYAVLKACFEKRPLPYTGLFLLSESGSYGICRAAYESGLRIPEELSVVTIGESWHLDFMVPALTSIGCDQSIMMEEAVSLLRSATPGGTEQKKVKAQLYRRTSTKAITPNE